MARRFDTSKIDLFEAIGGSAKCREISAAFYAPVAKDATLRRFFPGKTLRCATEEFAAFLVQILGGPSKDFQKRWWLSLRDSHARFPIGAKERDAWMVLMKQTLAETEISEAMRSSLSAFFEVASAYLINAASAVTIQGEIERRWEEQRALDDAVAAAREGEARLTNSALERCFRRNRAVFANFVAVLIGSGHDAMAERAHALIDRHPDLAHERYSGRTLLHAAAAAGNTRIVTALLRMGVDADVQDDGGHSPLYAAANECPGSADVVRVLIQGGAQVDACEGVKRCTPLHMAARRGHVEVAGALLSCGANLEARDSSGETPLRRAVNCGQTGVAALLLARGANRHSVGSKGLTPQSAARTTAMRELLGGL
jgi:truncated hemoglobin YjbI